jgi:cytochrome c553
MKYAILAISICIGAAVWAQNGSAPAQQAQTTPAWAFAVNPPAVPGAQPPAPDNSVKHVPGSNVSFTVPQTRDLFNPPDWYPDQHPPLPQIVAHGRMPNVRACGYCHLPNGQGRPENAGIAGLPAQYIEQQMADYHNGLRKSSEPKMGPPANMLVIGKNATPEESKEAAEYFASLKFKPWIRVVEAKMVPKTKVQGWMLVKVDETSMEPIGERIIEMPTDLERTELRDSNSSFIAYVPPGSIKKGEQLVTTGGPKDKTIKCAICHGPDLRGLGNVPPIAGRSPSYTVRQLYDMQHGNRTGAGAALMKAVVANLTEEDMVNIVAYTSSRTP